MDGRGFSGTPFFFHFLNTLGVHWGRSWTDRIAVPSNKPSRTKIDRHVSEAGTGDGVPIWTSPSSAGPECSCQPSRWVLLDLCWATRHKDARFCMWWWHMRHIRKDKRSTFDSRHTSSTDNRVFGTTWDLRADNNSSFLSDSISSFHVNGPFLYRYIP